MVDRCIEVLFGGVFTGLSDWLNGIRNMEIFQSSFHDERKIIVTCSPLIGVSEKAATRQDFF
jgi:uncharacterized membrane protein